MSLAMLEEWDRKHYKFTIASGGHVQPGDGYYVKLEGGGREVIVSDYELNIYHDEYTIIEPTIAMVIEEAIKRWHANKRLKLWYIVFGVEHLLAVEKSISEAKTFNERVHAKIIARCEEDIYFLFGTKKGISMREIKTLN